MSGGRTPLGDVTNTMRNSQTMSQLIDAKERKRAKERAKEFPNNVATHCYVGKCFIYGIIHF
jgi:hypothetical protein